MFFFGGSFWDPPVEDLPGHFGAALWCQDRDWTGGGRRFGDVVLPVLGETQEGARGESVPRSFPVHAATQLAHVGLLCTQDELGQLQQVRGVPLNEIGGVLPGTREVGSADQTAALTARVDAFWLRWEKEARSDVSRKVEAEAQKLAQGEDVASESSAGKKSSVVTGKRSCGRPPKAPGKVPGVTPAGQTSELLRLQSDNELLKGMVALLQDQVAERNAQLVAVCRDRQRADELLKERDSQLPAERSTATKGESAWRTREKKLLDELEVVRGQRGTKRTAPEPVAVQDTGAAEDKAWLTQCAVELRAGLQQAATATALLEDSLKRVDKEAAPPRSLQWRWTRC